MSGHHPPGWLACATKRGTTANLAPSRLITPTFLGVMAAAFAFFMYVGVLVPIIPTFVEDEMRGGELGIGLAIASFAGAAIVGAPAHRPAHRPLRPARRDGRRAVCSPRRPA